jgi:hypothetical protein
VGENEEESESQSWLEMKLMRLERSDSEDMLVVELEAVTCGLDTTKLLQIMHAATSVVVYRSPTVDYVDGSKQSQEILQNLATGWQRYAGPKAV